MKKRIISSVLVLVMAMSLVIGWYVPTRTVYADTENTNTETETEPEQDPQPLGEPEPEQDPQDINEPDPEEEPDLLGTPDNDPAPVNEPVNPEVLEGWQTIDEETFFYVDGEAVKGMNAADNDTDMYYFDDETGALLKGLIETEDGVYFADATTGALKTGIQTVDGTKYLFDATTYKKATEGLKNLDGKKYYVNSNGSLFTGWKTINSKKYYFDPSSCAALTGFKWVGGRYYYFYEVESTGKPAGTLASGLITVNGKKFYIWSDTKNGHVPGQVATQWTTVNGAVKFFYLNTENGHLKGEMALGIVNIGKYTYGFDENTGTRILGWHNFNGNNYYFYKSTMKKYKNHVIGNMARSTTIDGKKLNANGTYDDPKLKMIQKAQALSSNTSYLILADVTYCRVGVFKGSQNNWELLHYWTCSPGKKSTPTVTGTFTVKRKGYMFISEGIYYCYYYTVFYGNYYFHSILYSKTGKVLDGRLGQHLSHGCIRLNKTNAYNIYKYVPVNSKVVVYK